MIDKDLLNILACPDTQEDLVEASPDQIHKANQLIGEGKLLNRSKKKVTEHIDGGLIQKETRRFLYPVVKGIPVLLIDEAIALKDIE